jgi:pimeloyl-ACP methyl ester carboxylesterase
MLTRRSALKWAVRAAGGSVSRVFVLVHGSWHGGWCWRDVERRLRAEGHTVFAPTLTGLAERAHLLTPAVNLSTHVTDVARLIEVEELEKVTLVGHSYGGLVISHVASRVASRLAERVYLDAFVPSSGQTGFEQMQAKYGESWRKKTVDSRIPPMLSAAAMGVTEPARAAWVDRKLTPHPLGTYEERLELDEAVVARVPARFIRCARYAGFGSVAERVRKLGWRVQELDCGHDAMLAAPEELTRALLG